MKAKYKKPIRKTEREKALERRISEQKKEIKFQAAAIGEINTAVNAVLSAVLKAYGRANPDGSYTMVFNKPDIDDGYVVKTVVDDNGFYVMTARKEQADVSESGNAETAPRNGEAAEKEE